MKKKPPADPQKLSWDELGLLWGGLVFAHRSIKPATQGVTEQYSLGPRGAWIILLVASGQVYPSDVTRHFRIGNSLVSAELSRLVESGLVKYHKNAKDRRRVELSLTAKGEQAVRSLRAEVSKLVHRKFSRYSREEILLFSRMLQDFIAIE
jgi:DNA-binding MarR family transcriptional regulator